MSMVVLTCKQTVPIFSLRRSLLDFEQSGQITVSILDNMSSAAVSLCDIRQISLALNYMMCCTIAIRHNYLAAERK